MIEAIGCPFTQDEAQAAYDEWYCNCGPLSLAFALRLKPEAVRGAIPAFEERHYTSPMMMKAALAKLERRFDNVPPTVPDMFRASHLDAINLVRVQWTGPWTKPGSNPKWAYRQTHWLCSWVLMRETGHDGHMAYHERVFDCNGGIMTFDGWKSLVVPKITATYPRADGGWFPTHVWRIAP